jgi:hypothetical protein
MAINLSTLLNQNSAQLCKAWVNFNGTLSTPITPRSAYNVSSITKNASGDYTINFATALADTNYSAVITTNSFTSTSAFMVSNIKSSSPSTPPSNKTTTALSILVGGFYTVQGSGDMADVNVIIFGN